MDIINSEVSRRSLLLGGASLLALSSGCSSQTGENHALEKHSGSAKKSTVASLTAETPFYIAHRGSGDNWPEHTAIAYAQAIAAGAGAIDVAVNATKDGVLVCHHDRNTERMTGQDHLIADTDYATLQELTVDARQWLGPGTELQPITLLKDVLDEHAETSVIFIDDKQGTNTLELLGLMDEYSNSREHFVWKQSARGRQVLAVREAGYKAWGYFDVELMSELDELEKDFDFLGISHLATDEAIRKIVSLGKPVICWEVHHRHMRERLSNLGVQGMMCSNIPYVMTSKPAARVDAFKSGKRAPGDLPWTTDRGWRVQPRINEIAGSITLSGQDRPSYLMGSMAPVERSIYEIQLELRWPEGLPENEQHAGLCFGQSSDAPYRVVIKSAVAGYHLVLRRNGSLELFHRDAEEASGTLLGKLETDPVVSGQWITLWVNSTETGIGFARIDSLGWRKFVRTKGTQGGYLSLSKNYPEGPPVEFRQIKLI